MSSTNYRLIVEKILDVGIFPNVEALANEIGMDERELSDFLKECSEQQLPDLAKFQLLNFSGVTRLAQAIDIVRSEHVASFSCENYFDVEKKSIRWIAALDSLKEEAGFVEDKQLAEYLKIPTSSLSDFRRGRSELSPRLKFTILDFLGFHKISSGIEFLLSDELSSAVKRARQRRAKKIAEKNSNDNNL